MSDHNKRIYYRDVIHIWFIGSVRAKKEQIFVQSKILDLNVIHPLKCALYWWAQGKDATLPLLLALIVNDARFDDSP